MAHKQLIAHTSDGDMPCEIYGDLEVGERDLKRNILKKYPTATFTVIEEAL